MGRPEGSRVRKIYFAAMLPRGLARPGRVWSPLREVLLPVTGCAAYIPRARTPGAPRWEDRGPAVTACPLSQRLGSSGQQPERGGCP